ncbi:hypothetical protein TH53_02735 [Pedobacter lusitanus]|uniref:Contig10, whole genome shotgun sequence n=1 Tax=Pedobacter lusitanus TaxID=1503925 RepID=A0A0D0GMY7_9SPHI|nr:hypothetical protein [Pedobacter lusitanus]KIO78572.1 hypothetical protein TH53_02735 [Pedobacter lusitanus]
MKIGLLLLLLLFADRIQAQDVVYEVEIGTAGKYKKDPTPRLAMYLAFDLIFPDCYLPLQLFKLIGVKKMKIESPADPDRDLVIVFNRRGQWIQTVTSKDTLAVIYKDNAPYKFISHAGSFNKFYYAGDTVISVNKGKTQKYIRKGRIFHKLNNEDAAQAVTVYSNTNWDLPLKIHHKAYPDDDKWNVMTEDFFYDEYGNLILDKTLHINQTHFVFKMENGLPVRLNIFKRVLSGDQKLVEQSDPSPDLLNFSYEYFEK